MRVGKAILWRQWRRFWWCNLMVMAILFCLPGLASKGIPFFEPTVEDFQKIYVFFFYNVALFALFDSATMSINNSFRPEFPPHLYAFPITTTQIVFWLVILRTTTILLSYLAAIVGIYSFFHWIPPILEPILFIHAFVLCVLAAGWLAIDLPYLRLPAPGLIAILFGYWFFKRNMAGWETASIPTICLLVGFIALAFRLLVAAVARDRRGDARNSENLREKMAKMIDLIPSRHRPFRSPHSAQFWFEWRIKGWGIPATFAFMLVFFQVLYLAYGNPSEFLWCLIGLSLLGGPYAAFAVGILFGKGNFFEPKMNLETFRGTLPLSDQSLAAAKYKAAAVSLLTGWAMGVGGLSTAVAFFLQTGRAATVEQVFGQFSQRFGSFWNLEGWTYPLAAAASLIVAWTMMSLMISIVMAGKDKRVGIIILSLVALIILLGVSPFFVSNEMWANLLRGSIGLVGLCAIGGTAYAIVTGRRLKRTTPLLFAVSATLWSIIAVLGTAALWSVDLPIFLLAGGLGVLSLAVGTPSLGTLTLSSNRHCR